MVTRRSRLAGLAAGLGLGFLAATAPAETAPAETAAPEIAPRRVLSMNLCTDQLAMLVSAPGQLISVSYMAQDPLISPMADEAAAFIPNRALAEDIQLLQPDLVLAGTWSAPGTVALLRRLGHPVVQLEPAASLEDLRTGLRRMGAVLGQPARAEAVLARFDRDLAALGEARVGPDSPRAAFYEANAYAAGPDSLAGAIMAAAGLRNLGEELGFASGGVLPMELLLVADPDLVITDRRYRGASRSEEVLDHPAIRARDLRTGAAGTVADRDWICGTPHLLGAISRLRDAR